ncbi:hypothetical protein DFH08DRAFT_954759 [Mycena albidolilacea]|uniref:Uncharacterized protein n=1 Tax=Mycena albidolilacea TaxID=1033008 RepID=A0AAD7EXA0_9AGAR|nr:hypothetical protein DFH08DRAFT_954759 [Mycena albidolilacea]
MSFFTKFCVALLAFSQATAAVSNLQTTTASPKSGEPLAVTWTPDSGDTAPLTLVLFGTKSTFSGGYAFANNVNPKDGKLVATLPDIVSGTGFTLGFVSMSDTRKVLASSPEFPIGVPAAGGTTAKPTATSSHVWIWTESMSMKSVSTSHSVAPPSASHSGSAVHSGASPSKSGSVIVASMTIAFPSALSQTILSFPYATTPASVSTTGAHPTSAPSASASAHTGGAVGIRVPALGLAVAMGALFVSAWAV